VAPDSAVVGGVTILSLETCLLRPNLNVGQDKQGNHIRSG